MTQIIAQALPPEPAAAPKKRRRPLLWTAITLPVAGWAALAMGAATPLKHMVEKRAGAALGRDVTIGGQLRILVTPFSVRFSADDVRVANPAWASDPSLLDAGTVSVRLATFDLLIGKPGFRSLAVQDGRLDLERSKDGKASWTSGKAGTLLDVAAIRQLDADGLTVHYRDPRRKAEARVTLASGGRGTIDLSGTASLGARDFTLTGTARSGEEQPTTFDLRARTEDFALALQGEADGPLRLANARLTATARGHDFARLASLGGIALPALPDYELRARLGHVRKGWHFSHVEGRIGQTDLAGALTLDQRRARPLIVARLASHSLHAADAMALFSLGAGPDVLPIDMAEPGLAAPQPRLLPDAPLSPKALRRFDAVVDYTADSVTGAPHSPAHLAMKLALVSGLLRVSPASVDLAGGFISTDLLIDARTRPALASYDIRLSPTPMGRLLSDWGVAPAGTTAMVKGRIQLAGRGDTLREALGNADGRIALILAAGEVRTQRASASSLDMANLSDALFAGIDAAPAPTGLHCGLIAFTVRKGLATADPILIDTDGHVLTGGGRLDLRDERLDMRLDAEGKQFAFFARPSPVTIAGTLADPVVMREPVSWFSPARMFGLPMALPNLGAILGFVDPDEADAPACGPILRGAPATAQRERGVPGNELASLP